MAKYQIVTGVSINDVPYSCKEACRYLASVFFAGQADGWEGVPDTLTWKQALELSTAILKAAECKYSDATTSDLAWLETFMEVAKLADTARLCKGKVHGASAYIYQLASA